MAHGRKNCEGMSLLFGVDDVIFTGNKDKIQLFLNCAHSIKVNDLQNEEPGDQDMEAQGRGKEWGKVPNCCE